MHGRDLEGLLRSFWGSWSAWQPPARDRRDATAVVWNTEKYTAVRRGVELGTRLQQDRWIAWALLQDSAGNSLPIASLHMPHSAWSDQVARRGFEQMATNTTALLNDFTRAGYSPVIGGDWNLDLIDKGRPWGPVRQLQSVAS